MASKNSINLAKSVDPSKITFEGPLANNYGGKYAKVLHEGSWLLVQTPKVLSPFGVNVYEETDKNGVAIKKSYALDVSFNGYKADAESGSDEAPNQKVKELFDMVTMMEDCLVKHAHKNAFSWVDDPDANEAVCKALLRSGIKWSRDKNTKQILTKYAPRLKLNLPVYEDGMGFKAYLNTKDNPITSIDELLKVASGRCELVAICKCDRVTFNGGKYGYKWSVQQLKLYTNEGAMPGYAFIDDSDDEEDETTNRAPQTNTQQNFVEDSSEEEQEDEDELDAAVESDEDEEEEEPAPPPVKKKVVRKKVVK